MAAVRSARGPRSFSWATTPEGSALLTCVTLLFALGVLMSYSTTAAQALGESVPRLAQRHTLGVLLGGLVILGSARLPLQFWRRLALPLWVASVALLAVTLLAGQSANGAQRWLSIPGLPMALQPAEFARVASVLAAAALLARGMESGGVGKREVTRCTLLLGVPVVLLLLQPDFGSALVLVVITALLCFTSGMQMRVLALPAALTVAGAAAYVSLRPYALARLRGFLDPWPNAQTEGFQLVQSFVAFGRGGLLGVGMGDGRQKLHYLPEAHTDFILAMIAEELGLLGVLLVLGCFAAFARVSLRLASQNRDPFALLLVTGATGLVIVPALLNAAVVMGLVPTTGLALPFLSHGSNALLCVALAVGILLRASSPDERRTARRPVRAGQASRSRA